MIRAGSVVKFLVGSGFLFGTLSFTGCGDDAVRTAPEAVIKAKKEDVEKASAEANLKAIADAKKAKAKAH